MPDRYPRSPSGRHIGLVLAVAFSLTCAAHAEPLVKIDGGKPTPAIVTTWEGSGKKILLTVKDGVDPKAVADAINDQVDKVRAKVKGGRVYVKGKTQDDLLRALAEVDFGDEDDLGALAAADLASDDDLGSGSSLRAKTQADLDEIFADRETTALGSVVAVKPLAFPRARVQVRVLRAPKGPLGKNVRKGKSVWFQARLKTKNGTIDWTDEDTQLNAGAWFLKKGDKVRVKIGKADRTGYEAELLVRQ